MASSIPLPTFSWSRWSSSSLSPLSARVVLLLPSIAYHFSFEPPVLIARPGLALFALSGLRQPSLAPLLLLLRCEGRARMADQAKRGHRVLRLGLFGPLPLMTALQGRGDEGLRFRGSL